MPGTFYGLSNNGWMDTELFGEWFKHHFLVHAPSARPLLLLLDGHASHYNPGVLRIAAEEDIILFLPATSYHAPPPAPRQWVVFIHKEPLKKGMSALLCAKPWQGSKSKSECSKRLGYRGCRSQMSLGASVQQEYIPLTKECHFHNFRRRQAATLHTVNPLPMCLSALPERKVLLMSCQHALSHLSPPPLQLMR